MTITTHIIFFIYGFLWQLLAPSHTVTCLLDYNVILVINDHTADLIASKLIPITFLLFFSFIFNLRRCIFAQFRLSTACIYLISDINHFLQLLFHLIKRRFVVLVFYVNLFIFKWFMLKVLRCYLQMLPVVLD